MSSKQIKKYLPIMVVGLLLLVIAAPYIVDAKLNIPKPADVLPGTGTEQPKDLIKLIINTILKVAGVIALLFVIIGGFQYILSGANEELAESGKKTLRNALIGVAIIVLSFVIVNIIANALQQTQ